MISRAASFLSQNGLKTENDPLMDFRVLELAGFDNFTA